MVGCKSPEEKACVNTVRLIADSGVADGREGTSKKQRRRDCVDSLARLRQQLQPSQDQWFTYLDCLSAAQSMSEQFDCLAPLSSPAQVGSGSAP